MRKLYVALMVALVVGLIAVYQAHATSNEIHACYSQTNGAVRIVNSAADCRTGESSVTWNVEGPQGPPGEKGDSGVSKAFATNTIFGGELSPFSPVTPDNTIVASLDLPAGKFVASSKLDVFSSTGFDVRCVMAADAVAGQYIDEANVRVSSTTSARTTIPLHGAFELTSAQKLGVYCGGSGTWGSAQLSAIQVDQIDFQNPDVP